MGRVSFAYVHKDGRCKLVSRNGNEVKALPSLNISLAFECRSQRAILDAIGNAMARPIGRLGISAGLSLSWADPGARTRDGL